MADALLNANGVMAAAALKQQGFDTALENAKGSVEALQITIGSAPLPVLTELMNTVIAPGVNILTDFASEGAVTEKTFAALSPTINSSRGSQPTLLTRSRPALGSRSPSAPRSIS